MDYKKIYKAANYFEAHFIKGLLKKNSIGKKYINGQKDVVEIISLWMKVIYRQTH